MNVAGDAALHRAQNAFRRVLSACAEPGTVQVVVLETEGSPSPFPGALDEGLRPLVRLFVDRATTFAVVDGQADALANAIISETHARRVGVSEADFVIVPARAHARERADAIVRACRGMLVAPEKGATVFVGCARLIDGNRIDGAASTAPAQTAQDLYEVEVCGPGVKDVNRFFVDRIDWAVARQFRHDEFPCGIEIMLVDREGRLVVIPRSSALSFEDPPREEEC